MEKVGSFIRTALTIIPPKMHCAKFGGNWPSGSGEEDENVKIYHNDNNNDNNNDDNGQRTKFDQKSSFEPSAQVHELKIGDGYVIPAKKLYIHL
mgnify:CR=1 FL=1